MVTIKYAFEYAADQIMWTWKCDKTQFIHLFKKAKHITHSVYMLSTLFKYKYNKVIAIV